MQPLISNENVVLGSVGAVLRLQVCSGKHYQDQREQREKKSSFLLENANFHKTSNSITSNFESLALPRWQKSAIEIHTFGTQVS
jgi:hypothetical protein